MTEVGSDDSQSVQISPRRRNFSFLFRVYYALAGIVPGLRRKIRIRRLPARMSIMGCEFGLHPAKNATEFRMYRNGCPPERQSIMRLQYLVAGKNCLFLDVGANIGVYSVLIGSKMGPGSKIIAFEPNPDVAARLRRNLELNGLDAMTQVEGVALGSAESTGMLSISRRNQGASSLAMPLGGAAHDLEVPFRRLSNYLSEAEQHDILVLKADIEGYEDRALASILDQGQSRRPDHILVEISHASHWQRDLLGDLRNLGYKDVAQMDGNLLLELVRHPEGS